jgi:hypothetical protein
MRTALVCLAAAFLTISTLRGDDAPPPMAAALDELAATLSNRLGNTWLGDKNREQIAASVFRGVAAIEAARASGRDPQARVVLETEFVQEIKRAALAIRFSATGPHVLKALRTDMELTIRRIQVLGKDAK